MFGSIDRSNNVEMSPRLKNCMIHYDADKNVGSALIQFGFMQDTNGVHIKKFAYLTQKNCKNLSFHNINIIVSKMFELL